MTWGLPLYDKRSAAQSRVWAFLARGEGRPHTDWHASARLYLSSPQSLARASWGALAWRGLWRPICPMDETAGHRSFFRAAHERKLPLLSLVAITVLSGWLGVRALLSGEAATDSRSEELPLVILMDSHHPARVYDEETRAANATNADVLSDVLLDLPIRRQRESIGPEWHRDEEILRFDPELIVIHYSGFRQADGSGPRERLRLLISFFGESDTRFLIYSRAAEAALRVAVNGLLADLYAEHPGLLERVSVFGLDDYGPPSWLSPLTTNPLKLRVKQILAIP